MKCWVEVKELLEKSCRKLFRALFMPKSMMPPAMVGQRLVGGN